MTFEEWFQKKYPLASTFGDKNFEHLREALRCAYEDAQKDTAERAATIAYAVNPKLADKIYEIVEKQ